jgi:hypothetical protein
METEGILAPETPAAARGRFASLAPAAKTVLREVGRELSMDTGTYQEQIDDDLRLTAQEAIFASLLAVRVGTLRRQAFGRLYRDVVTGAGDTAAGRAVRGSETAREGSDE